MLSLRFLTRFVKKPPVPPVLPFPTSSNARKQEGVVLQSEVDIFCRFLRATKEKGALVVAAVSVLALERNGPAHVSKGVRQQAGYPDEHARLPFPSTAFRVSGSSCLLWPRRVRKASQATSHPDNLAQPICTSSPRPGCALARAQTLHTLRRTRELLVKSGGKPSGKIKMRGDDHMEGDRVSRYGSLASLIFNAPHLYATLVGSGW